MVRGRVRLRRALAAVRPGRAEVRVPPELLGQRHVRRGTERHQALRVRLGALRAVPEGGLLGGVLGVGRRTGRCTPSTARFARRVRLLRVAVDGRARAARQIELVLSASFTNGARGVLLAARAPALLLKRGDSRHDFPTMDNYTFKVTMETKMRKYSVELCASQFARRDFGRRRRVQPRGAWNPWRSRCPFRKRAVCPSATAEECSGHGTCRSGTPPTPTSPRVACDDGWTASDCNFPSCAEGSFVVAPPGADAQARRDVFPRVPGGKHRRRMRCVCARVTAAARPATVGEDVVCVLDECERRPFPRRRSKLRRAWRGARRTRTTRTARGGCGIRVRPGDGPLSRRDGGRARLWRVLRLVCAVAGAATAAFARRLERRASSRAAARVGRAVGRRIQAGYDLARTLDFARAGFSEATRGTVRRRPRTRTWTRSNARTLPRRRRLQKNTRRFVRHVHPMAGLRVTLS